MLIYNAKSDKISKMQLCNSNPQIHDTISINLLFECVKTVEFNFNSHVFLIMYQEIRFLNQVACFLNQEERPFLTVLFPRETENEHTGWNSRWLLIVPIFQMQMNFSKVWSPFCSSARTVWTKIYRWGARTISCKTSRGIPTHYAGDVWSSYGVGSGDWLRIWNL